MSIERRASEFLPIQRVGIALYKKTSEFGIISAVSPKFMKKLELAFTETYRNKSVRDIIASTDPHYRAGSYLIFSPHVRPENSLCWLSVEDPELHLGGMDELERWNMDTFLRPHYFINPPIVYKGRELHVNVCACSDEKGELWI
jgi:hypothetical protein